MRLSIAKRKALLALVLTVCLLTVGALAEAIISEEYTDTTIAMTQDYVIEIRVNEDSDVDTLQPDRRAVELLNAIYDFVWQEKNPPARYYDEMTQDEIWYLIGGADIDLLHLTESMRLQLEGQPDEPVKVEMVLDVDYRIGQLIVVVLGIPQADGSYEWHPYRGHVLTVGQIEFFVPEEDWAMLAAQPVNFHVLTDRVGARGTGEWHERGMTERQEIFSKEAVDITHTVRWYTETDNELQDKFSISLVDLTDHMEEEQALIGYHLREGGEILKWFPDERQAEALLMLPEHIDPASLIAYDVIAVEAEYYVDAYGDVTVEIVFGTQYLPEKAMVVLAGFPIPKADDTYEMVWYVLRADALAEGGSVEIGLKQLNLQQMMEEPMMMVVISEPVDQGVSNAIHDKNGEQ